MLVEEFLPLSLQGALNIGYQGGPPAESWVPDSGRVLRLTGGNDASRRWANREHGRRYLSAQASYNITTRVLDDLDVVLSTRLCDCIELGLLYRHVRREIWLEIGLQAFPQSRLQLLFPRA